MSANQAPADVLAENAADQRTPRVVGGTSRAAGVPLGRPRLGLLQTILLVNTAIVLLGGVVGTFITVETTRQAGPQGGIRLVLIFAVVGVVASVLLNYFVLRAAFVPLTKLERVAEAVRSGDLSARVPPIPRGDPQVSRLALTFNRTLDQLERDRAALRSVASQVITAQEEERKRIARELHDDTAQLLFAQLLRVTALKNSPSADVRATAAALEEMTVETLEGVRRLALEMRPPALDDLGLNAALDGLAQRFREQLEIPIEIQFRGMRGRMPADVELVLYRVAQEALTNVAKHANATNVLVDLDRGSGVVTLSVKDNGRGFSTREAKRDADGSGGGLGLFGMAERVALVGGGVTIWSTPGLGVEVFAYIPLDGDLASLGEETRGDANRER